MKKNKIQQAKEELAEAMDLVAKLEDVERRLQEGDTRTIRVVTILDRSGSMATIREQMEEGHAEFIAGLDRNAMCTLVQFDTEVETVYADTHASHVPRMQLVPRGMTALNDAIGKTLSSIPKDDTDTVVMIITDGAENASLEWSDADVRHLITNHPAKWKLMFLGTSPDAVATGKRYGIKPQNSVQWTPGPGGQNVNKVYRNIGSKLNTYAASCNESDLDFTAEDRVALSGHASDETTHTEGTTTT